MHHHPSAPNPWLYALAPLRLALEWRAGWEFAAMFATQPLLSQAPRGDGHPVLVLPRFLGCDLSTLPLRSYLIGLGYAVQPWELGVNVGPRDGVMAACLARLETLQSEYGRKVSLIGWSLGGLYARELAKAAPGRVRSVITLGTPFVGDASPSEIWRLYEGMTGDRMGLSTEHGPLEESPPVPTTSIFSRSDGIVAWPGSLEQAGRQTENIEVESSHLGLAVNPLCLYAIADRLAQPEDDWRPFERQGARAWLYPDPQRPGWL